MSAETKAFCWSCLVNFIGGSAVVTASAVIVFAALRFFNL